MTSSCLCLIAEGTEDDGILTGTVYRKLAVFMSMRIKLSNFFWGPILMVLRYSDEAQCALLNLLLLLIFGRLVPSWPMLEEVDVCVPL